MPRGLRASSADSACSSFLFSLQKAHRPSHVQAQEPRRRDGGACPAAREFLFLRAPASVLRRSCRNDAHFLRQRTAKPRTTRIFSTILLKTLKCAPKLTCSRTRRGLRRLRLLKRTGKVRWTGPRVQTTRRQRWGARDCLKLASVGHVSSR